MTEMAFGVTSLQRFETFARIFALEAETQFVLNTNSWLNRFTEAMTVFDDGELRR